MQVWLHYTVDGQAKWEWIAFPMCTDPEWGCYPWQVPDVMSDDCYVLIQDLPSGEILAISGRFAIVPPDCP